MKICPLKQCITKKNKFNERINNYHVIAQKWDNISSTGLTTNTFGHAQWRLLERDKHTSKILTGDWRQPLQCYRYRRSRSMVGIRL